MLNKKKVTFFQLIFDAFPKMRGIGDPGIYGIKP